MIDSLWYEAAKEVSLSSPLGRAQAESSKFNDVI